MTPYFFENTEVDMNRLETIINYIDENKVIADIGSDHGITSIKIYEEKNPKRVIATDISKNSLQKLVDKLEYLNYDIETMVTDGLTDLPNDVEEIIISGMGGFLIRKILEDGISLAKKAEKLILQGNNSLEHLRKWLHDNNFEIIDETLLEDEGFKYTIIVAKYSIKNIIPYKSDFDYIYGKKHIEEKNPLLIEIVKDEINHLQKIVDKISGLDTDDAITRIEELEKRVKNLKGLLCELVS